LVSITVKININHGFGFLYILLWNKQNTKQKNFSISRTDHKYNLVVHFHCHKLCSYMHTLEKRTIGNKNSLYNKQKKETQ